MQVAKYCHHRAAAPALSTCVAPHRIATTGNRQAIASTTSAGRKAELERQLLAYCCLDTWAMVRLWAVFTNTPLKG